MAGEAKNKILLVYPGKFGSIFPEIPMTLLYLSWALKKNGFEVEILDTRIRDFREIKGGDYLFVGISSLTGLMIKEGLKVAQYIRALNRDIPIVWGGVHPTLLPEQTLENPYVDIVVRGEGEITVQELAERLRNNSDLTAIKGISFKRKDGIISNPDREFMDLNQIDIELPYDLLDLPKYCLIGIPVHTSRGCPYRCGFCYNTAYNKRSWRHKSAERVLDEIKYVVKRFSCREVSFIWEDEFFIDVTRVRKICEGILQRGLKIRWVSFCRFNSFKKVDDDTLKLIERSGCQGLTFGAESGSQRILDEVIKKDITIDDVVTTIERLSKTNIPQVVSFMSGLPTETPADMKKTLNLIDKLVKISPKNLYLNGIFLYTPYPGTPLFNLVTEKYNYKPCASLEEWANFGVYRNVGITWHTKKYVDECKTISILTRFPFYLSKFALKDVKNVAGGKRLSKFPFSLGYYVLANLAILRWKHRFFKFPIELALLEKVLEKIRGFV